MIIDRYVCFKSVFHYFYEKRTRSNKNALFEVPELHKYIKYWLENEKMMCFGYLSIYSSIKFNKRTIFLLYAGPYLRGGATAPPPIAENFLPKLYGKQCFKVILGVKS